MGPNRVNNHCYGERNWASCFTPHWISCTEMSKPQGRCPLAVGIWFTHSSSTDKLWDLGQVTSFLQVCKTGIEIPPCLQLFGGENESVHVNIYNSLGDTVS